MRLKKIALRGLTTFVAAEPVVVDLDALGPGLIALVGANGSGKSTLLSAVPASLYRTMPDRPGSIYEYASGKDAFTETVFQNEHHELKVRLQVDADRRTAEQYIFEDGASLTTGRAAEAASAVEERFGTEPLFMASVYASQAKAGDFLKMNKGDRKALMIELLGLDYLERLHVQARDRASAADAALWTARALLEQAEKEAAELADAERGLDAARNDEAGTLARREAARTAERAAAKAMEEARVEEERIKALWKDAEAAAAAQERASLALTAAEAVPGKVREDEARELRALAAQNPDALEAEARKRHATAEDRLTKRRTTLLALVDQAPAIRKAKVDVEALSGEADLLRAAAKVVEDLKGDLVVAQTELRYAKRQLERDRERRETEMERLQRQASLIAQAPCSAAPTWDAVDGPSYPYRAELSGVCPLLADARAARAQHDKLPLPNDEPVRDAAAKVAQIEADIQNATLACDPLRLAEMDAQLPGLRETASKATALEHAEAQAHEVDRELNQAVDDLQRDLAAADGAREKVATLRNEIKTRSVQAQAEALKAIEEARAAVAATSAKHDKALDVWGEATAIHGGHMGAASLRLEEAIQGWTAADEEHRARVQATANAQAWVVRYQESKASAERLASEARAAEDEAGDWTLLARALGRDGVQALEIDAAGPEVAKLVNELLAACYGARFSISFETLREKKSKAGEFTEAFDVRVFDQGSERPVEALSGGERVVVGEAVGLAISIFNARKSGVRWETLFRDETAGALDPENAAAYVEMLRRSLKLGGFHQVLFVSHSPEVWERADARLHVADGKVTPEGAGRAAVLEPARA